MGSCYIAQEAPLVLCDHLEGGIGSGKGGKLKREGIYIHVLMTDSHHCTVETNTTLQSNYTPI